MLRWPLLLVAISCYGADSLTAELNLLRSNPARYAAKLDARKPFYRGAMLRLPNQVPLQTEEGVRALDEAIRALKKERPLPAVAESSALSKAAQDHVRDIGPKGLTSHKGTDGSTPASRIRRHQKNASEVAEVMSFGPSSAEDVIIDLLIDDGVRDRGHRKILLDPAYRAAGGFCGPHKTYGTVCVIDFSNVPAPDHAIFPFEPEHPDGRSVERKALRIGWRQFEPSSREDTQNVAVSE